MPLWLRKNGTSEHREYFASAGIPVSSGGHRRVNGNAGGVNSHSGRNSCPTETMGGSYWFYETNADVQYIRPYDQYICYSISIHEMDNEYLAHFYIYGFRTFNEFQASVTFNDNSIDLIFDKYVGDNYIEPFSKGDLLLTLKKENNKYITFWGEIQPILKENESPKELFKKSTSAVGNRIDIYNYEIPILRNAVLVNELDNSDKGLIYLGMTKDELISFMDTNGIDYDELEWDTGEYLYSIDLFNNAVSINIDLENIIDRIRIGGCIPLKATSTQAGLFLGDTVNEMIELYGDNYTAGKSSVPGEEMYQIYVYKFSNYQFYVYFLNDTVVRWGISDLKYAYIG